MKSGLSKREQALIFIAVVLVLLVLAFRFAVMPIYDRYQASLEEYDRLSAEQVLMESKIQNEATVRADHEKAEKGFHEIQKRYPAVMPNEDVDRILTGLCLENNLNPIVLGMSELSSYEVVQAPTEQDDEEETTEATEPVRGPAVFSVLRATMNLNGDYDSLKRLISAVEKIEYIRISWVSFSRTPDMIGISGANISVLFEVTMMNEMPNI